MKSSMYGVMQYDASESMITCAVSFVHVSVAIHMSILTGVSHLVHQMPRHVDTHVEWFVVWF
jgi:hypothetical protein